MYAQHVRKWSLKTNLMPLISLVFYVSNMLLLITCAPTTAAAAAAAAATAARPQQQQQQLQQQQQQLLQQQSPLLAAQFAADAGAGSAEEESYYIAVDNGSDGGSSSNNNNNSNNILSRLLAGSGNSGSNSLSSSSNIKLKPATVFDRDERGGGSGGGSGSGSDAAAQETAAAAQSMQKVPNTLINSQIFKLLFNGMPRESNSGKTRRHIIALPATTQQQQQQQQRQQRSSAPAHVAGNYSSSSSNGNIYKPPQRYLIESYEVPESLPVSSGDARSRRDYSQTGNGQQQFQQLQQQHRAQQQQQQSHHHQGHGHKQSLSQSQRQNQRNGNGNGNGNGKRRNRGQRKRPRKRGRQRGGRYCSARDPGQLAFEAPTVFEGKIISMTPDRRVNFSATLEVKTVYKQQDGFRLPKYVRLQFALRNNSGECDIYRERMLPRGLVRGDDLEQGVTYMTFVQQKDLGNFTILGQPIRRTQLVVDAVKLAVSDKYAQLASISNITASNSTVENGKELHITCLVEGRPPPKVTWFKDDKSINRKRNLYQFKHHKRRSELIVRSFNSSDAGIYECRAKNKVSKNSKNIVRRRIQINAYPVATRPDPTRSSGHPCPEHLAFCFHGGTCMLITEFNFSTYYCNCPDGFGGERCESNANIVPENTTYKTGYIADDPNAYGGSRSRWT